MEIDANNVLDAWKKTLAYILDNGHDFKDRDGRMCRETLDLTVHIASPEEDFDKPIDLMQQFEWIYPAKEELVSVMLSSEESATYEFSYGPRIFNYLKAKDQINDFIIPLLKKDPTSRRAIISLFNPATDSNILSKNIPSLLLIYFKVVDGKLHMSCAIRSNDFFIGWPGNVYQLEILHNYVAEKLGMPQGSFATTSYSAHVFHEHFELIHSILGR